KRLNDYARGFACDGTAPVCWHAIAGLISYAGFSYAEQPFLVVAIFCFAAANRMAPRLARCLARCLERGLEQSRDRRRRARGTAPVRSLPDPDSALDLNDLSPRSVPPAGAELQLGMRSACGRFGFTRS